MREQIRRILGLIASGRLSAGDALPLLAALHPKLGQVQESTFERLFGLLDTPDFGPDRVADLLMALTEPAGQRGGQGQSQSQWGGGQQSQSQSGPPPPLRPAGPPPTSRPSASFKVGGASYPFEDLGDAITARVEEALGGLLGKGNGNRPARPGTILRIETEDAHGASFSANLPLSLSAHAERLIPPHALASLERGGLTIEALKLLLQAGPPPGKLLSTEDEHGNSVELSIQ